MSDGAPHPPSPRVVFDKTIQVSALISIFLITLTGIGGGFELYLALQDKLRDQKEGITDALHRIDNVTSDVRVLRESLTQLRLDWRETNTQFKAEQKETDNALRKSLDSIADDLLKVRMSLASRGGRTGLHICEPGSNCGTDPGLIPATDRPPAVYPTSPSSYQ